MNTFSENNILFQKIIPGGWNFSHPLKKGTAIRLTDIEGGVNVSTLFFNQQDFSERYNMADTLKAQFTSYLTQKHALFSDMGRVLLSILNDTCGWHDTMTGCANKMTIAKQYGEKDYQNYRNDYHRDGFTSLLTEIAKYGMGVSDMHSMVNFFTKVDVDEKGDLAFVNQKKAGSFVDLQAEMDTLIVLNTCPHPFDTTSTYHPKPLKVTIWKSECLPEDNPCYHYREENKRGFINTINYQQ